MGLDPGFTTDAMAAVFSPEQTLAAILEFEAGLALSLGDTGIAPSDEAAILATACAEGNLDAGAILATTWTNGTPIIALRQEITSQVRSATNAGRWFHFGATTQDAIDTGLMLQSKSALQILKGRLGALATRLRDLTLEHRGQRQIGRSFLQHARPTTFGFRTATWLDTVLTHLGDLERLESDLVVQLGDAVGTRDTYGERSRDVVDALARRLGLTAPDIAWHGDRSRIRALAVFLEEVSAAMARIASDVTFLASSEVAEVSVRSGSSSSMPDKRNPLDPPRAAAAASVCTGARAMITTTSPPPLDRAYWYVERPALALAFQSADAAVEAMVNCLQSLQVDPSAMASRSDGEVAAGSIEQIDLVLRRYDRILG